MDRGSAWRRLAGARTAVLSTLDPAGAPRPVPICHVVLGEDVYFAVDDVKPKRGRRLARLADIERDPRVGVLAQHYAEDWAQLWWVRADGTAAELEPADPLRDAALAALARKYAAYAAARPPGPVVRIRVARISGWCAGDGEGQGGG